MLRPIAPRQDPGVHARMKRLDTPVHHLGESGQVADRAHIDRCILDRLERAAGCEQLVTEALQPARERGQSGLVANR
jgi:hypothetical protein